jgi:hypothetical protein
VNARSHCFVFKTVLFEILFDRTGSIPSFIEEKLETSVIRNDDTDIKLKALSSCNFFIFV